MKSGSNSSALNASALSTATFTGPADDVAEMSSASAAMAVSDAALVERESELRAEIEVVERGLCAEGWPAFDEVRLIPFVELEGGSIYSSVDFVTGLICVNRDLCNPSLSMEAKRKQLFGSDQIVS